MNRLIRFFLHHHLLVQWLFYGVMALGLLSLTQIRKEGFPTVELNIAAVTAPYPGASAEDVELNVIRKLEEAVAEVDGVQEYTSVSQENGGTIVIQIDEDADQFELRMIANDLQRAVDQVRDLPTDLDESPAVHLASTADIPIIHINLAGAHETLRRVALALERGLEALPGVSGVDKVGYFDREVHVEVDPVRARAARVSFRDVVQAIQGRNLRVTGGTLESYLGERTVVTLNQFRAPEEVAAVILRATLTGPPLRLDQVARVTLREKDQNLVVRNNGRPGMSLLVRKLPNADIVRTLDRVKAYMAGRELPAGVSYFYSNDQSARTRLRLKVLGNNALLGFVLVVALLMATLNRTTALWTALGVPFSLLATFILLNQVGMTINVVTLAGLVLVLGLLVDDAIVVGEKISAHREAGLPPLAAAQRGTEQMWRPVFVASLTTILAFTPMFYLGGIPGKFAWAIPTVVIVALAASLFESFFILPHHVAASRRRAVPKRAWVSRLEQWYHDRLLALLDRRYLVLLVLLLLLAGSLLLVKTAMRVVVFPQEGADTFFIKLQLPRGASLAATEARAREIEAQVAALPPEELQSFATRVGHLSTEADKNRGEHSNWAVITVYLSGEAERRRTAAEIIDDLRGRIRARPGERILFEIRRVGPPVGKPVEIRVASNDDALRRAAAESIMAFLRETAGVTDVESDHKPGKDQLVVKLDYERLAEVGVSVRDVAEALRIGFDGLVVSSTTGVDETLDYRVIMAPEFRRDPEMIYRIPVSNRQGRVLTLRDVLTLEEAPAPLEYHHVNGVRTETITGQVDPKRITVTELASRVRARFGPDWQRQAGLQVHIAGEAREAKKIFQGFLTAGVVALLLIYITVSLLFGSLTQPLIVMAAIPFAVIGVIWSFFFHGMPLSFFSTMGTLGLVGVVVNDAIIMVTHLNEAARREDGGARLARLAAGARARLRPVLLTTFTTVVGLLPTAYGLGGRDTLIIPLTMSVAYGLVFGSVITLVLVPNLYAAGQDLKGLWRRLRG